MLLKDTSLAPLKLVYSDEIPVSAMIREIREQIKAQGKSMQQIHKEEFLEKEKLTFTEVEAFIRGYLPMDTEMEESGQGILQFVDALTDLMMTRSDDDGMILWKEFRDQIMGVRMDDGVVSTWGDPANGRLGRTINEQNGKYNGFVTFPEDVTITKITCGDSFTLAIAQWRKVFAWGSNAYGQLGIGNTDDRLEPTKVILDSEYINDIAGGGAHAMALDGDGNIWSWGLGEGGRLGHGGTNLELFPRKIIGVPKSYQVAAGHSHSGCLAEGEVFTWGRGTYGRLGHGQLVDIHHPRAIEFFHGKYMSKLCLSVFHSAVLTMNGEIWSWGNSKNGRLGKPVAQNENQLIPTRVGQGTQLATQKIVDMALGFKHGLAISKDGSVYAWGCGLDGKLGLESKSVEEAMPKEIKSLQKQMNQKEVSNKEKRMPLHATEAVDVACSNFNTYVLTNDGSLWVTGNNNKGQLGVRPASWTKNGDDDESDSSSDEGQHLDETEIFIEIKKLEMQKFQQISANGEHCMAVTVDGEVYAWGDNNQGQLGIGFIDENIINYKPAIVNTFKRIRLRSVSTGTTHGAFVTESGQVYCTGNASSGKLGIGENVITVSNTIQYMPRIIYGIPNIKKIACGTEHTVAMDYSKQIWIWGGGWFGKLGVGDFDDRAEPQCVPLSSFYPNSNSTPKEIAAHQYSSFVLTKKGDVYACGSTRYCGITSTAEHEITFFHRVNTITQEIKHIAAGIDHAVAVTERGQLVGWGRGNKGKLGDNIKMFSPQHPDIVRPSHILMKEDVVFKKVDCGNNHTAALSVDGKVFVWGSTAMGRLGIGRIIQEREEDYMDVEDSITQTTQIEEIRKPTEVVQMTEHFRKNLENIEAVMGEDAPEDIDDEYPLQTRIKNEPVENYERSLLQDDQRLIFKIQTVIQSYDNIAKVEEKRKNNLSKIESVLMSKIQTNQSLPVLSFRLTLPAFISCNLQLFEYMIAVLQTHPCYLAEIIKQNPNLPAAETAEVFTSVYGDLSSNPAKIRSLMALYKLVVRNTVTNAKDFRKSLRMKTGDLSSYLYFKVLNSQDCNLRLFHALVGEIFKIIYEVTKNAIEGSKPKKATAGKSVKFAADVDDEADAINAHHANILQVEDTQGYALDYISLQEMENPSPDILRLINNRQNRYLEVARKIIETVKGALSQSPQFRNRFTADIKLSDEVKFMFKEIPALFKEKYQSETSTNEGEKILRSKIVSLFFQPLLELLKEPVRLKRQHFSEVMKSLHAANISENYGFDQFIHEHAVNIQCVIGLIEGICDRVRIAGLDEDIDSTIEKISRRLIDIPDFDMADLLLKDMLQNSLEHTNPKITISVENLLQLYQLLYDNRAHLIEIFAIDDPIVLILSSLEDASIILRKARDKGNHTYMLNLEVPNRFLLRERAVRACENCKAPLTYSLISNRGVIKDKMQPLSIPENWECGVCGNNQEGWHMNCQECDSPRRDFPPSALFKFYECKYEKPELTVFQELLGSLPSIPSHIPVHNFMMDHLDKITRGSSLHTKIQNFLNNLTLMSENLSKKSDLNEVIETLAAWANSEYESRMTHRVYLDQMFNVLKEIEEYIWLEQQQFTKNTKEVLKKAFLSVQAGSKQVESMVNEKLKTNKAQGRFTVTYLLRHDILSHIQLPESLQKKTMMLFTERFSGGFFIRVVLHESRDLLCFPRSAREVKLMGFDITPDKIREMRRTMNSRAQTSFEGGRITFNVFQFVGLLNQLLGKAMDTVR